MGRQKTCISSSRTPRFESLEDRRVLATLTVNADYDSMADIDDGNLTLREAIRVVNDDYNPVLSNGDNLQINTFGGNEPIGTNDTIIFNLPAGQKTITLDSSSGGPGHLEITQTVTIDTQGQFITIDGNDPSASNRNGIRIFNITNDAGTVTIDGLTLTGADPSDEGPGGAISSEASLVLRNSFIEDNYSSDDGGGVALFGTNASDTFLIENTTFSGNSSGINGGGLFAELDGATLTVRGDTAFTMNTAADGGGLYAELSDATLTIEDSTFDTNTATNNGGGIAIQLTSDATATMRGLTVTGNKAQGVGSLTNLIAGGGGGIYLAYLEDATEDPVTEDAEATIEDSIITGNHATGTPFVGTTTPTVGVVSGGEGGGVLVHMASNRTDFHAPSFNSKFKMTRSLVNENTATNRGGGVFTRIYSGGEATIENSHITGNDAGLEQNTNPMDSGHLPYSGAGVYAYLFSGDLRANGTTLFPGTLDGIAKLTISGTTIDNNEAGLHGGGVAICAKRRHNDDGSPGSTDFEDIRSDVFITNSTISTNTAGFLNNPNTPTGPADPVGEGGGVHIAIYNIQNSIKQAIDVEITHTTVSMNKAHEGGGIYSLVPGTTAQREVNTILQNTLVSGNNEHNTENGSRGTPDNFYGSINVAESIYNLFGNAAVTDANQFFDHRTHASIIFANLDASNIDDMENEPDLGPLMNNGGVVLPDYSRIPTHALDCNSPALDAGDPTATAGSGGVPMYDQRGAFFTRVYDLPVLNLGPIDIGAFESSLLDLQTNMADFNLDGFVNGSDFVIWQSGFGIESGATKGDGDANGDGRVDVVDLMVWSEQYNINANNTADFNNDGVINGDDMMEWHASFGVDAGGDADGDGDTDGMDFLIWQASFAQTIGCHQWTAFSAAFLELAPGEIYVITTDD